MTPNARFEDFLKDIEPSATTKSNASQAHRNLRDFLAKHETFRVHHLNTFLTGSYKRDTAIRPRVKNGETNRPDIDVAVVTNYDASDSPAAVLDELHAVLKEKYSATRKQIRSIGLSTAQADMDVVPLIEPYEEVYYIPDRKLENWLPTNPPGHTQWTIDVNEVTSGRFKPLVKLVKWWRRENPTISKRPKGFVLEVIAANLMNYSTAHYGELFVGTLEAVVVAFRNYINGGVVPNIPDPSVSGNNIMDGISFAAFEGFYNRAKAHAELGRAVLTLDDQEKATDKWREIFGPRFPGPPSTKSDSLLAPAAPAAAGYTFPDRQIRPPKPDGFA